MAARSVILHVNGFPGAGKLTVADGVAAQFGDGDPDRRMVLLDNHRTGDPILAVVDRDVPRLAPAVWDRVGEVRAVVRRAIRELSPPGWSFAFTNVLFVDQPDDPPKATQLRELAADRGSTYVPVVLRCRRDELLRRVVAEDRSRRLKWTDAVAVDRHVADRELHVPDVDHLLELDTTDLSAPATISAVLAHLRTVTG